MKLKNLKTKFLGKNTIYYKKIDSTQSEIWRMLEKQNIQNGTTIISDIQTNGKGTHGRVWHTDEENNIAFSFYVETNCNIEKLNGITTEIAEILVDIFLKKYGVILSIKEPNDIVCKNKKIGGILTESKIKGNILKFLIIGIGINTNKVKFPKDIQEIATSIKKEFNVEINNFEIITEFLNKFENKILRRIK